MAIQTAGVGTSFASIIAAVAFSQTATAYYAPPRDRHAIRSMAGCYEVDFHFAETIPLQAGYRPRSPFHDRALEWIVVDQDSGNRISLQHVLLTPQGPQKHWRQEWELSAESVIEFKGDSTWVKRALSADEKEGRWVQRVYQVDDSPRYECSAPWVHWGSNVYWECEAWSPLPKRELAQRSDYNVLVRRNRHLIRSSEWLQEEDNVKLRVEGERQTRVVKEKGETTYRRVEGERCSSAGRWWEKNKDAWHAIQTAWKEIYATHRRLRFSAPSAEKAPLWRRLSDLGERAVQTGLSEEEVRNEALALIKAELTAD